MNFIFRIAVYYRICNQIIAGFSQSVYPPFALYTRFESII